MKSRIFCATIAWALSANANASDWQFLASSQNNDMIWVDATSVRFAGDRAKAWFLENYNMPTPAPATLPQKFANSVKQLNFFDCAQGTWGVAQVVFTAQANGSGEVISSTSIPPTSVQYEDVVPDSVSEIMLSYVCSKHPAPPKRLRPAKPAM